MISTDDTVGTGAAQNAIVFQAFGIASRHLMYESRGTGSPLTYPQTFLSGTGSRPLCMVHLACAYHGGTPPPLCCRH